MQKNPVGRLVMNVCAGMGGERGNLPHLSWSFPGSRKVIFTHRLAQPAVGLHLKYTLGITLSQVGEQLFILMLHKHCHEAASAWQHSNLCEESESSIK